MSLRLYDKRGPIFTGNSGVFQSISLFKLQAPIQSLHQKFITMATQTLPAEDVASYDYLIVGGGTAGCVVASRLAEYLPKKRILLIEGGPTDVGDNRVLLLNDRIKTISTDLDYGYTSVPQPNGMYPVPLSIEAMSNHELRQ